MPLPQKGHQSSKDESVIQAAIAKSLAKLAFSQTHADLEADRRATKKVIPDPDLEDKAREGKGSAISCYHKAAAGTTLVHMDTSLLTSQV